MYRTDGVWKTGGGKVETWKMKEGGSKFKTGASLTKEWQKAAEQAKEFDKKLAALKKTKDKTNQIARWGDWTFTWRFTWTFFYDPWMGPWKDDDSEMYSIGIDILARSCMPAKYLPGVGAIPDPPFFAKLCLAIEIIVKQKPPCPDSNERIQLKGRGTISFVIGVDLVLVYIEAIKLEMGLELGVEWENIKGWCYWKEAPENGVGGRRRYWDRRRRATRECNPGQKTCNTYLKAWIKLKILCFRGTVEFVRKWGRIEWWLKFEIYNFWAWWGQAWVVHYHNLFWRKDM